jgi:hypothetical protein
VAVIAATVALSPLAVMAQQPNPNDPNNNGPAPAPVPAGGGVRFQVVGPGGGGGAGGGVMNFAGGNAIVMPAGPMMNRDLLAPVVMMLGELNLSPDFNLSGEQKQKIQSIRDDFKSANEAFKKDHADELKQLDDQQKELMDGFQNGNIPDPGAMMELMEQRRAVMQNAPDGAEHASQIKALLTPDQVKKLEEKEAAMAKEREEMQARFPMMRMGGPGMSPPPPPNAPAAPAAPADKEKDKDGKGR